MRKDLAGNLFRIVNCLKEGDWLWLREIARRTGLHHKTVSRLINKHLFPAVEEQNLEALKLRMIRLKPNTSLEGILRFIKIKEEVK